MTRTVFGGPCSFLYMALPVEPRSSISPSLAGCDQASYRIKEKLRSYPAAGEVEQTVQRSRFLVGGTVANPSQAPVILDEAKDRGLVGDLMVHVVLPRKRGDHEQRESRTVTATPLGGRRGVSAAETGTGQKVIADLRLIDDRIHYVVVPAVRIIVSDNDGGVSPERAGLNLVDGINQEFLLIEGIGIPGMTVKCRLCLQEAHGGQLTGTQRGKKVLQIILMLCLVGSSDGRRSTWRKMVKVGGLGIVLEGLVVRDVIGSGTSKPHASRSASCHST